MAGPAGPKGPVCSNRIGPAGAGGEGTENPQLSRVSPHPSTSPPALHTQPEFFLSLCRAPPLASALCQSAGPGVGLGEHTWAPRCRVTFQGSNLL